MGPWVNLTAYELNAQVYPVATYSYLGVLLLILLVTDFVRYKPIILLEAASLIGTYILLILGKTLQTVQVVEFTYAVSSSCEIAYYTYIYAKVAGEHYQRVTSYTRAAVLGGFFLSGVLGQVLISTYTLNYYELNFLTTGAAIVALLLAVFLPRVTRSIYFHQDPALPLKDTPDAGNSMIVPQPTANGTVPTVETPVLLLPNNNQLTLRQKMQFGFRAILRDVKYSYMKPSVVKWSVWWACGTCLNLQVANYIQPLWEVIYPSNEHAIYNGAVESTHTLLGALTALGIGFVRLDWSSHGEWMLSVVSILDGICLFIMSTTKNIWVAYVTYIIFRVLYQMMITIASFQVAKDLRDDTHGLIFGCNTFLALLLQTILVFVVVDESGLAASSRLQFMIYGGCCLVLAIVFLIAAYWVCCRRRKQYEVQEPH